MKTSESISKFAVAFCAAQAEIKSALKDSTNPHFKSRYADLESVIEAVKPSLTKHGISFLQPASPSDDGRLHLTTRLLHTSGEWMEDTAVCPLPKADPQGFGSAMTYLRRYSLASFCGVAQTDDDGNGATPANDKPSASSTQQPVAGALGKITKRTLDDLNILRSTEEGEKAVVSLLKEWKLDDFSPCTEGEGQEALAWVKKEMKRLAGLKKA